MLRAKINLVQHHESKKQFRILSSIQGVKAGNLAKLRRLPRKKAIDHYAAFIMRKKMLTPLLPPSSHSRSYSTNA